VKERALTLARGALAAVEANRRRIDNLNVYPVPDGDTGTNLALTVRAVVDALEASTTEARADVAREVARAALMGARGNSGVILSQIVRGACDVLGDRDDLPGALRAASDAAYRAVRKPVEGTMLTAIREMADEASTGATPAQIVARGDDCVGRTTDMLEVLRAAGVVDAGAAGLVEIARGIAAALAGEPLPEAPRDEVELSHDAIHQELSLFRYCTVFVVEGEELDVAALEDELEQLGDSLLVVGDRTAVKVHVHTDDPGRALSLGVARGAIAGVEIANMHEQTAQREERLLQAVPDESPRLCDTVVVVAGKGNTRLFESFGARAVDGGRTMNPSTSDILGAVEAAAAPDVVLLPNNKNVILSAEQAAAHASKNVRVLPTESIQAGLAAMVAFDPARAADENAADMADAVAAVATGAVTVASRDVDTNGVEIRKGAWLGLAEGEPVVGGDSFEDVARAVVERMLSQPRDILTLLTGEEPPVLDGLLTGIEEGHPGLELEVHEGGQPNYPLLLVAE
jgi:DAK2 domain fusion protein YloV